MADPFAAETEDASFLPPGRSGEASIARVELRVVAGPCAGRVHVSTGDRCTIGSHPHNDLALDDRTVSRFHCELRLDRAAVRVRDLESHNGTYLDGVSVVEAFVRSQSRLTLGDTVVEVHLAAPMPQLLSTESRFGNLVGSSVGMRAAFARFERAAKTDATVVITGETGTGKEEAASALHENGTRADGPFVVVDCASMPRTLIESELFGHERGAFTDALATRVGAFEAANGGTLFLDELGELPLDLQPRLLRAIESRSVRRIGSAVDRPIDVRIVAATNRDLRALVTRGGFREDLFYRLAVIEIRIPPLRERPEDIADIARQVWRRIGGEPGALGRDVLDQLVRGAWPGNVRQLRNWLQHYRVLEEAPGAPGLSTASSASATEDFDASLSYEEARDRALSGFEMRWVKVLLASCDDNVSEAARRARMSRVYLHRLLRRHGLR